MPDIFQTEPPGIKAKRRDPKPAAVRDDKRFSGVTGQP